MKQERYKSKYVVERSSYHLRPGTDIVHLRMLSPDEKFVEYFSYMLPRACHKMAIKAENLELIKMEAKVDAYVKIKKSEQLKLSSAIMDKTNKLLKSI